MSCFRIEKAYETPEDQAEEAIQLIASITVKPSRAVFAAAAALAARMAGSDLVLIRPGAPIIDPKTMIRELIDAADVPIAADLGCAGPLSAQQLIAAGARKVVISTEALLHPEIIREVTTAIGPEQALFLVDCVATNPGRIEVLDGAGRATGIECSAWLDQIEELGGSNVILRPNRTLPSEGLLSVISGSDLTVFIERKGWNLALANALGAQGIVTEGALGCHEQQEQIGHASTEVNS